MDMQPKNQIGFYQKKIGEVTCHKRAAIADLHDGTPAKILDDFLVPVLVAPTPRRLSWQLVHQPAHETSISFCFFSWFESSAIHRLNQIFAETETASNCALNAMYKSSVNSLKVCSNNGQCHSQFHLLLREHPTGLGLTQPLFEQIHRCDKQSTAFNWL